MHLYSFVTEQGHILWVMFLLGIGLGLGYDLNRTLRRISKITKEGAALGDFFYWIVAGLVIWQVQNAETEGILRFCQLFIGAAGMILYYAIGSKLVRRILYVPLAVICKFFSSLYRYMGKGCDRLFAFLAKWTEQKEKRDDI